MQRTMGRRLLAIAIVMLSMTAYGNNHDEVESMLPEPDCYVQLFAANHHRGASILLLGPIEIADLGRLPGRSGGWNDAGGSFHLGKSTTVTFWTQTHFQGGKITYMGGVGESTMDAARSMKIMCADTLPTDVPGSPIFVSMQTRSAERSE